MKVLSVFLVFTLLVSTCFGCSLKGCCCGCGGLDYGCGLQGGCGLAGGCGYGYGNGYGYSSPYGLGYNQYNPYGSVGCCNPYGCNPVLACLMSKLKPCLIKKSLLIKKMCKKNHIARKCLCEW